MKHLLFFTLASLCFLGCRGPGGPAERAGRSVDTAVYNTGTAIERTGQKIGTGVENTGEKIGAGIERTGQKIENAAN